MNKKIKMRLSEYIGDLKKLKDAFEELAKENSDIDPDPVIITDSSFYEKYFDVKIELDQEKCNEYFLKTGKIPPGVDMEIDLTDAEKEEK